MREMSVTEQRYKAVLAVIGDGRTVSEVCRDWGVSRRTMHRWLARYEGDGLEGLNHRSHRPAHSPHQMPPPVEAWCSRCAGHTLTGERAESPSSWRASGWRPRRRSQLSIAAQSGLRSLTRSADRGGGKPGSAG